jgi:hypothetical protein
MRSALPSPDRRFVTGGLPVVLRIRDRHGAVRAPAHVALTDLPAKPREIILLEALVDDEHDIDLLERLDGLKREVAGVAAADAEHRNSAQRVEPLQ